MRKYILLLFSLLLSILITSCSYHSDGNSYSNIISSQKTKAEHSIDTNSTLEVHFIDVGQADAALVICDNEIMLIDGGNASDSSLIYSYLKKLSITHIDYIIATHPHEDHIGGLPAALVNFDVKNVYAPSIQSDSKIYNTFIQKVSQKGLKIQAPTPGDKIKLGSANVVFYAPIYVSEDINNNSIVLKIIHGNNSFLFTGDAEREEEQDILNNGYDLSATVLKVGHHGSASSTTYPFLREIMPQYAVISVGKDNPYNHPSDNTLSRLRDAEVQIYRTDIQGDIIAVSNGKSIKFSTKKNKNIKTNDSIPHQKLPSGTSYIGNRKSKKFHLPTCYSLPLEKNRIYFNSREEAIENDFSPCGNCSP